MAGSRAITSLQWGTVTLFVTKVISKSENVVNLLRVVICCDVYRRLNC
jgi:hypothetical protein